MVQQEIQDSILGEFDAAFEIYGRLSVTAGGLLSLMLSQADVQIHSITNRCKERSSLAAKIAKAEKDYEKLSDVTDVAGVRIITYFAEDVDKVAEIVKREFQIDRINSIDQRKLVEHDKFGYQSLHFVAEFNSTRCALSEYSKFASNKFEIQIRSILQHAWAEIEHDLGYKSAAVVPREVRRRFSRIAGLFELADDEFSAIRTQLKDYAVAVSSNIKQQPENIGIDKISLRSILSFDSCSRTISQAIVASANATIVEAADYIIDQSVEMLKYVGLKTIAELESSMASRSRSVINFSKSWVGEYYDELPDCVSVFYLSYIMVAEQGKIEDVLKFLEIFDIGIDSIRLDTAKKITDLYKVASRMD